MSNRRARIYDFEPLQVAATETAMWEAYYDRRPLKLFRLSLQLLREQMAFGPPSGLLNGYRLTKAAFVFKRGRERADYNKALPWLRAFYRSLHNRVNGQWDPVAVAALELEWWIIHRHDFGPGQTSKLEKSLCLLCATLYHVPENELDKYAEHRAIAMLLTDAGNQARVPGEPGGPDWPQIQTHLEKSYAALSDCLKQQAPTLQ